jgi:RNA polymerase sigma-70 factor (ECF subfamily)
MTAAGTHLQTDLETIVRRHQAGLWRYLRLLGCDPTTAEDVAQETFLALLAADFEDRHPRSTAAWLRKKARYLFLDRVRARTRRERNLALAAERVWRRYAAEDDGAGYRRALEHCVEGLAPKARRAVDLRYSDHRTRAEMAGILGLRENGVKTLLQRARAALRDCVERRLAK